MKKLLFTLIAGALVNTLLFAQTSLPTSWSFTTTSLPNGWTESGIGYYTGSGNTIPAAKFDGTGDYVQIFFADEPGELSYYLTGNSFSGGKFSVLESANGVNWDTLQNHTNPPAGTYSKFTNSPKNTSRYIKFLYTYKAVSNGGNIGLDDVELKIAAAGTQQEISISQGNSVLINNGNYVIGNNASTIFDIYNLGTVDALIISGSSLSGIDASDFSISGMPTSVAADTDEPFTINFNPTGSDGTKYATLTINNNDTDENPFVFNLIGIKGNYATEPTTQPTNLTFSNLKSYTFNGNFNAASGSPQGYIVLRKTGSAITETPADGATYQKGDYIGNAQVAMVGVGTSFTPSFIVANTDYHFSVFSYNGVSGYENYLQNSPLTGVVSSSDANIGSYYSGVLASNSNLLSSVKAKISAGHQQIYYSNYGTTIISDFESRDTTDGQKVVTCVYSGYNQVYYEPFAWNELSREHTFAFSWMPITDQNEKAYSDLHNLFPVQFADANATRSNYPLGEVVNVTSQFGGGKFGTDANGKVVYEPRDEHKGDAARAMFYMLSRYNGDAGLTWGLPPNAQQSSRIQDQNLLKKWHYQDLPDNWEIARNDFIHSIQKNRNPFIDSVSFACHVDFTNMTYIANPSSNCYDTTATSIKKHQLRSVNLNVWPNPSNGNFNVELTSKKNQNSIVSITDLLGNSIYKERVILSQGLNFIVFDGVILSKGIYHISVVGEEAISTQKIVVN